MRKAHCTINRKAFTYVDIYFWLPLKSLCCMCVCVNMISQYGKLGQISNLEMYMYYIEYQKYIIFVWRSKVICSQQRSYYKNLVNTILKKKSLDISYLVCVICWIQDNYCFPWRSEVICSQQWSNGENLVNTILKKTSLTDLIFGM